MTYLAYTLLAVALAVFILWELRAQAVDADQAKERHEALMREVRRHVTDSRLSAESQEDDDDRIC